MITILCITVYQHTLGFKSTTPNYQCIKKVDKFCEMKFIIYLPLLSYVFF